MRTIKLTSLLIFLIAFLGGKAHSPVFSKDKFSKTEKTEKFLVSSISQENPTDDSPLTRKRRSRGIEVDVPQIADVSFVQYYSYTPVNPVWIQEIYSCTEYFVHETRGPPPLA